MLVVYRCTRPHDRWYHECSAHYLATIGYSLPQSATHYHTLPQSAAHCLATDCHTICHTLPQSATDCHNLPHITLLQIATQSVTYCHTLPRSAIHFHTLQVYIDFIFLVLIEMIRYKLVTTLQELVIVHYFWLYNEAGRLLMVETDKPYLAVVNHPRLSFTRKINIVEKQKCKCISTFIYSS